MDSLFDEFVFTTGQAAKRHRANARFVNIALDKVNRDGSAADGQAQLGVPLRTDAFRGDCGMRTLTQLLKNVDANGYERSAHQVLFHDSFTRCCARIIYREEWPVLRPAIMQKNGWDACNSEVMISTPRRFGKTFSIAMYVAALSLAVRCEVVVFSPARRASRKLLERCVEFLRVLDADERIVEYNQEACRVCNYEGSTSLIRSFPSKVGVRFFMPS